MSPRPILSISIFSLLFTAVVAGPQGHAQAATEPWQAEHFSVEPRALYAAASAVTAPDGAPIALLTEDQRYSFDERGRIRHTSHYVYKVLNERGAEAWDSLAVEWEPWHEERPQVRVRVILADGSMKELDPKTITEEPARGGDYKSYGDGKRLKAPFPAIAPGVVVEEESIEQESEPFFAQGHTGRFTLGEEGIPVEHSRVLFDAPASLPLRTATLLLPGLKPERSEHDGRVRLDYEVARLEPIDPRVANLPPDVARYPEIRFSTGASWQQLAAEYSKIVDAHADTSAVKPIVDKLIAGKLTREEKETAILQYVDNEVRYTGLEFGEAALVPHAPAEVLAQKYGDCKDKATLVVTMLRAAGIEAYVALLNAGGRMDVPENLPGMGLFDHAIVYVPGPPSLWIDATDRYARLGQLPAGDQGRLALVARPETTALIHTMEAGSRENVVVEHREIRLGNNGPANVIERTRPAGVFESRYRGYYADRPDKDMRENLQGYVKGQYLAEKLGTVERSDPADIGQPFELTLKCDKARRGFTDLDSAEAAIRLDSLFEELPEELRRKEDPNDKKPDANGQVKKPRADDWFLDQAFSSEWFYRIVPPEGFAAKQLPKDQTLELGPARLTESFTIAKDGAVEAHLIFDSGKRRYSHTEAEALRDRVAELIAGPAVMVGFEPKATVLMREGKVGEALAVYRALIAAHTEEPVYHLQLAKLLVDAGLGEPARAEAQAAVKLDPASALVQRTLAQILRFDLVGRELRPGADWAGAAEAYNAAAKLDSEDNTAAGNLAILYEYDAVGRRYSPQSHMEQAIEEYRKLGHDKLAEAGIGNNLAYALFYGGHYEEAEKEAENLNPPPAPLIAACEAARNGAQAGMAAANKHSSGEAGYKQTLHTAGEMLMNLRLYPEAAAFLEAGANGENAARDLRLAAMLRQARRHEQTQFGDTPADLVKRVFETTLDPALTAEKLEALSSHNANAVWALEDEDERKKTLNAGKQFNSQLARDGSSLDVTVDILMQAIDPKGEGSDETGYREKAQSPGGSEMTFYVVKEDGHYKGLDSNERPNAIGLEILDRVNQGKLNEARVLLNWLREEMHLEGGDDPYGGPVFPRFWTRGLAPDARRMRMAAGALLAASKPTAERGIEVLEEARKTATAEHEKSNLRIALSQAYLLRNDYAHLLENAQALLADEPTSLAAFLWNVQALIGLGRQEEALKLADERLKLLENDTDALRMKMEIEVSRGHYQTARAVAQKLVAQGNADANLLNSIAWYALYMPKIAPEDIETAIKATELSKENPHILHTLACLYAEVGRTKEAHDLLVRAMDELNLDEPNDDFWYAFGRIAEQYGEREAAIRDYQRLKRPTDPIELPVSSWQLAQNRLKAMGATK